MFENLDITSLREREDHAATQGFTGGLLLGVLLGVVLTLVFAPRRGDETRAAVAHKAVDVKDMAVDLVTRNAPFGSPAHESAGDLGEGAAIEREIGHAPTTAL